MFGNIIGMPVKCDKVIKELTEDLDDEANIRLWVGAWRTGASWNHAKIIAVDGYYLHTGGHNLWDQHYLRNDPVHDLSMEAEGRVTHDGHLFANQQWQFIKHTQQGLLGCIVSELPDNLPTCLETRVTVSEWPEGVADEFPPRYEKGVAGPERPKVPGHVPIISMGRYGAILHRDRPSDDAIVAMLNSAQRSIRCALQDLGPITLPGLPGPIAVPGRVWPEEYMSAMGRRIWEDGVDVEIALSNPGSIPGGLHIWDALYGNGWTCNDVAAEIVKTIQKQFPDADEGSLREKVESNLRLCYIRETMGNHWEDEKTMGMHAKHFIIDDCCYYVGSQNLYIADLAEWGLVIDDAAQTQKVMQEYWHPMWNNSYRNEDCNIDEVMDGLVIDRNGGHTADHASSPFNGKALNKSGVQCCCCCCGVLAIFLLLGLIIGVVIGLMGGLHGGGTETVSTMASKRMPAPTAKSKPVAMPVPTAKSELVAMPEACSGGGSITPAAIEDKYAFLVEYQVASPTTSRITDWCEAFKQCTKDKDCTGYSWEGVGDPYNVKSLFPTSANFSFTRANPLRDGLVQTPRSMALAKRHSQPGLMV